MHTGVARSICLACELTQSDNFPTFVRSRRSVPRVETRSVFCRCLRGFIARQVYDTNAPRPYFIKSASVYPTARVSSLIPMGKRCNLRFLRPCECATFCIASRRVDRTTKARTRTLRRNLFAVVRIAAESALRGGSRACDIRSLRASTRSFPV